MTDIKGQDYVAYVSQSKGCYKSWLPADMPFIGDTPKGTYVVREWQDGYFDKALAYAENCPIEELSLISNDGLTVLHYFVMQNLYDAVEILLKRGADPNVVGKEGRGSFETAHIGTTPLHLACNHGNTEMVKLLLSYGADSTLLDAKGQNVYHYMAGIEGIYRRTRSEVEYFCSEKMFGMAKKEIVKLVRADINQVNENGETPLQLLLRLYYNSERCMVRFLTEDFISLGADTAVTDEDGNTLLMMAVKNHHMRAAYLLAQNRSLLNLQNNEGETALHMLSDDRKDMALAYVLIEAGADYNIANDFGVTALHRLMSESTNSYVDIARNCLLAKRKSAKALMELFDCVDSVKWEDEYDDSYLNVFYLVRDILYKLDPDDDDDMAKIRLIIKEFSSAYKLPLIKTVVDAGFDINAPFYYYDDYATTLALEFIDNYWWRHPDIVKELQDYGLDVNAVQPTGFTLAYYLVGGCDRKYPSGTSSENVKAAYEGIVKGLEYVSTESMDEVGKYGMSAAHFVAKNYSGNSIIKYMIERGIDLDVPQEKADVRAQDRGAVKGQTVRDIVIYSGDIELICLLMKSGMDETITDSNGNRPIHKMSTLLKNEDFLEMLDLFKEIDVPNDDGETLFMKIMADDPTREQVEYFIRRGVDINACDDKGNTPLMYYAEGNHDNNLIGLLPEAGAEINAQNKNGETPLLIAIDNHRLESAKILLKHGADYNITDNNENSAASVSIENEYQVLIELMPDIKV